jgi:hypothetical protein
MPRYYFDLYDDIEVRDDIGTDAPDLGAAQVEAARILTDVARDLLPGDGLHKDIHVHIRNRWGEELARASLNYSVELR